MLTRIELRWTVAPGPASRLLGAPCAEAGTVRALIEWTDPGAARLCIDAAGDRSRWTLISEFIVDAPTPILRDGYIHAELPGLLVAVLAPVAHAAHDEPDAPARVVYVWAPALAALNFPGGSYRVHREAQLHWAESEVGAAMPPEAVVRR